MKILSGQERFTNHEKATLHIFKVDSTSGTTTAPQEDENESEKSAQESYTARILRLAEESKQNKSAYRSMAHICPTSVMVERLFSDAKHIMTADRRHMDPTTLEMWLLLKNNKDLWNAETVDGIINKEQDESTTPLTGNKRQHDSEDVSGDEYDPDY